MGRGDSIAKLSRLANGIRRREPSQNGELVATREVVTNKGLPLTIEFRRGIDDNIREGWVVDILEARGPDGPAGHLKLSYVPSETLARWFPSAWHYAARVEGRYYLPGEQLEKPEEDWSEAELRLALERTAGWLPYPQERARAAELEAASPARLRELWQEQREQLNARHARAFAEFLEFHLDKPLVDYAEVYRAGETHPYTDGVRSEREPLERSARRQGVASALYEQAALWLAERGLALHASGLQSDDAAALWESFRARGLVREVPANARDRAQRIVLDPQALRAETEQAAPASAF